MTIESSTVTVPTVSRGTRNAGIAALVGGVLNIGLAFTPTSGNSYQGTAVFVATLFVQALATALMLGGLYGLHRRYRHQYGRLGFAFAVLFGIGLAWVSMVAAVTGVAELLGVSVSTLEGTWFFVTLVDTLLASLYGVVLWRNGTLGSGGIVMAATIPIAVVLIVVLDALTGDVGVAFNLPLGIAWTAVGYVMVRDRDSVTTGRDSTAV